MFKINKTFNVFFFTVDQIEFYDLRLNDDVAKE